MLLLKIKPFENSFLKGFIFTFSLTTYQKNRELQQLAEQAKKFMAVPHAAASRCKSVGAGRLAAWRLPLLAGQPRFVRFFRRRVGTLCRAANRRIAAQQRRL